MYVCTSDRPKQVCMYVWGSWACMYVWGSWACMYVCMSHSKLQNQRVSEGVRFLIKTIQNLTFNSFFFWIVRGGTSWSLARLQTCMYVCLSSRPTLSMYVCTSDRPKQVCMYVWGLLSMYVCMSQAAERVCMYASNIHTWHQTYIHSKLTPGVRKAFEHVCMFENPVPVLEMKHTCIHSQSCLKSKKNHPEAPPKRVCMFQKPTTCYGKWNIHAQT